MNNFKNGTINQNNRYIFNKSGYIKINESHKRKKYQFVTFFYNLGI